MPAVQPNLRRRLRRELRQARDALGLSQDQVADRMDWSLSKVIRIENGKVGISTNDLKVLLELYGITDATHVKTMLDLAKESRTHRSWWADYEPAMLTKQYADYIGYEDEAGAIRIWCPLILPALLQTEEYAREIITKGGPARLSTKHVENLVEIRMKRQGHLQHREDHPEIIALVGEAAIRQQIGGPERMRKQLSVIVDAAEAGHVDPRIVPFSAGAHPGLPGGFTLLEFEAQADPDVLYMESFSEATLLWRNQEKVAEFQQVFERLAQLALGRAESIDLIRRAEATL